MLTSIRKIVFTFALFIAAYSVAFSQAVVTIDQQKDACNGLANGSVRLTVTSGVGPFSYFLFGLSNGSGPFVGPLTLGTPFTVSNLPADNYVLSITDGDPAPNFSTFIVINNVATPLGVTITPGFPINNTDCAFPTGQISITPTGGTGSYSFDWDGPGAFNSTLEDISGLPGGTYQVTVFDNGTNCSVSLGSIVVTDPSPSVQTVSTPSPQILCTGSNATISLTNSEGATVQYEVLVNGAPTGITTTGVNGPLTLNVPFASVSDGDILTIRAINGVCTPVNMSGAVTLSIVPLPVPALTGLTPVCAGTTGVVYSTDAGQSNYLWTVSAGGTITSGGGTTNNTVTVTWNTAGPQTVSVNYTNSNGCPGATPTVLNVTVNPLPVPTLTGPVAVCVGATGAVYTTEAAQTNYVWSVSPGGTITSGGTATSNTVTVTWGTAGPQTVSVNYNDVNGCTAVAPTVTNVTVSPLPVPTITGSLIVCAGSTGNTYTTEAGKTGYTWTVSGGGTITAGGAITDNSVTITWNTAAPQTVSVTYTDPSGCPAAAPTVSNITVNPQPTPTLTGSIAVCANTTGVVYTTDAGQTNYTWSVSGGGTITSGGGSTNNTVTVTWNTAGPQTVTVNYTNSFGCAAAIATSLNVTVNPLPVPTLTGSTISCVGTTGVVYTTDPGQTNYVWTISPGGTITAGGTSTSNTATVTWNASGAQSMTVSYTDANGCGPTTPTILNVNVSPLPVPSLTGTTPVCAGSTGNVYTTDAGQSNYVWTISAGGTITAGGTNADNTVTVTWTTAGARSVQVNYSNASGCSAAAPTTLNITVNPLPIPALGGPTSSCVGATGVVYTTDAGQSNYTWAISPGGTITAGGSSTDNTVTVTWTTAGPQTVSVNYTNVSGCTATAPTVSNVTVNPLPVATLTGLTTVCAGATGVVYTTDPGQTNYVWVVSGGTITAGGTSTSNTVTVTWATAGPQSVSITYTGAAGCDPAAPTVSAVTVNPVPTPTLTGTPSLCVGTSGVVYSTDAGQSNYVWTVSGGGTITAGGTAADNTVTVTWTVPGPQTVTVNYTNASGCPAPAATSLGVTVNPLPVPTLTGTTSACVGATGIVYSTDAGQTGYTWLVSPGGTITAGGTPTDNTVTITWGTAGPQTVSVNYTNANGCSAALPTQSNVTVNALPVPTLTGSTSVCAGSTGNVYTTEGGQTGYVWAVSPGGTITAGGGATNNTVTVTWNTAGPRTVSVNYTNAAGCAATVATVSNVTVNSTPVPSLSGTTPVCVGATNIVYSTDAGQSNYVWTVSGGGTITAGGTATDNTVTVTWSGAGAQIVTVNYTNASGCAATLPTSLPVVVNALPVPTLTGTANACLGATGVVYTSDAGQSNYVWAVSPGGTITAGGSATDNTVTVTWATSGAQTVSVSYTNANGCVAATPTVLNVNVNTTVTPTLTGSVVVCVGTTGVVYTTDAGQTNYVWAVSPGGTITAGGTATSNTVTVTWGTAGPQTVSVTYTDINGCPVPSPTVLNVAVGTVPTPTLTGSNSECIGATGIVYSTDVGQSNYVWTVSPGGTITAGGTAADNTVTITWTTAGAQTVTVNYTSSGCSAATPTSLAVIVNPLPIPALGGVISTCVGATGVVYTTDAGQTNYAWAVSAGGTITAGGTATDNTVTITWSTAGPQSVSVNYQNANGCSALAATTQTVTVNPLPAPTITGSGSVCENSIGNVYTTEGGQTNYIWSVSGGTITAGGTTADSTVTITWGPAGAATVSINYTNASGCSATTATVSNITINPAPVPTITGLASVCAGTTNVVYTTEAGQTNYVWAVSAGGTITAGGSATDNTVTVTWNTAGARSVSVNYTSSGCSAATPTSLPVTVNGLPTATLTGTNSICVGSSSTLTFTMTGVGPWDVVYTDGTTNFPVTFAASPGTVSVTPFITTNYSLVSVTNAQCGTGTTSGTATVTVNAIPGDQVTFGNDTWIGYVYTDAGPPITAANFASSKYRGFIDATDIDNMTVMSTYDVGSDVFNLDFANPAIQSPLSGPNVCGSFNDNYSVRFRMQKTLPAGVYTVTVGSDDGVRLIVNGVTIIDQFNDHTYTAFTGSFCSAGTGDQFVIEYYENAGPSRISFDYQLAPTPTVTTPVAVCVGSATAPTLTASSSDPGVTGFNWYSDAGLTNLLASGASFTPTIGTGIGEIDLSVVGSKSYFVTSIYAGCESTASTAVINVVNGASFTVVNSSVCESGGVVDLTTFITNAIPAGGTFVFTGHPNISGNNFDPSGLSGSIPITVDYSVGSCIAPTTTLTLTITNTSATTVPTTPVSICESSAPIDLNTLVSAVPAGGDFVFTAAAGITGDLFDPATLSGTQTITVNYTVGGGCAAPAQTFDINVLLNATITTSNTTVCPNDPDVNLLTLVTVSPTGGLFTFSGPGVTGNLFDPSAQAGTTASISVLYDAGGCAPVTGTILVTVRSAADPICNVVTGNCATVVITPVPTPATCTNSDGTITFNINPFTPTINNTGVIIDIQGVSSTNLTISRTQFNDPFFATLPMGVYDYTITYGDLSCIKTGQVTVDQSGTVGTPIASNIVQPLCAGSATGAVTIDIPGETGNVLEWSFDGGITDPFKPFTAGSQITGIPAGPAPTFTRVISVRRNSSDPCNASVAIVIQDANAPIVATYSTTDATCNAADGSITNITPSGGVGPNYEYSLDGGVTYQTDNFFGGIPGGTYIMKVKDGIGCEQDITVVVNSPGSVNSIVDGTDANCTNNGNSGSVSITITDVGTFQVAISTDQFNAPADSEYQNYTGPTTFFDLPAGRYYVYARSTGSLCPDRKEVVINGAYAITFDITPLCTGNQFSVSLTNISGDATVPFSLTVFIKSTNTKVVDQVPFILDASGSYLMSSNDPLFIFLQQPKVYEIILQQSMVNPPFCELTSEKVDLLVPEPITAQVNPESIVASFRDENSGAFQIVNIQGGSLSYSATIELVLPTGNDQSYEETVDPVGQNPDGDFEVLFDRVPAGSYEVTIQDTYGCSLVPPLAVIVPVDTRVIPPNIFTPNNDGINDTFYVRNLPNVGTHELTVTDRWGKQVFHSSKYDRDHFWDGEGVSDGVYFYKLNVEGAQSCNGWIEILRGSKP